MIKKTRKSKKFITIMLIYAQLMFRFCNKIFKPVFCSYWVKVGFVES